VKSTASKATDAAKPPPTDSTDIEE
jgi:hypothetical protein